MTQFLIDRRSLFKGAGALVVSIGLPGGVATAEIGTGIKPPLSPDRLDSWLAVKADGYVVAYFGKMDMGQGVDVAIAQIVAEELDVPLARVSVVMGDTALTVNQGGASGSTGVQKGGIALRNAALLHPSAAAGPALVDGQGGVAHHDTDPCQRHIELLGDDLGDRDIDTLAHIHLAEIGDDIAVRLDREPAVELIRGERRLDRAAGFGFGKPAREPERDDKRAGAFEEAAAVDREVRHGSLPYAAWAARRTARRIAICVPQRHLRPESPSRICCSEG